MVSTVGGKLDKDARKHGRPASPPIDPFPMEGGRSFGKRDEKEEL